MGHYRRLLPSAAVARTLVCVRGCKAGAEVHSVRAGMMLAVKMWAEHLVLAAAVRLNFSTPLAVPKSEFA